MSTFFKSVDDYRWSDARGDLTAGLTVGVMLIPQGMAYAVLAGVAPIYGLFASLVPLVAYPLLGTSRHLAVGVTAISMLIVGASVGDLAQAGTPEYVTLAVLLAAMVGVLEIGMGLARLGFLANLISRPVIAGFSTAAALIIASSQLGNLLGLELGRSARIHVVVAEVVSHLGSTHASSLALGAGSIAGIVGIQRWRPGLPAELIVVTVATALAWSLGLGEAGVQLVGDIPAGLPEFAVPDLDMDSLGQLGSTAVTLALIQFMSVISLGRVFANRHRYLIDPNRELMAIGASNFVGSFFQSLPVSGSWSRTTVNEQAGARSALSNVAAAALIGVTLLFLTPLFSYVPMPALAGLIVVAAAGLVDVAELRYLYTARESDGYVALGTFVTTLTFGIQEGILVGIVAATLVLLYRTTRPHVAELGHLRSTRSFRNPERFGEAELVEGLLVLRVEAGFSFLNARTLRNVILEKIEEEDRDVRAVVIDGMSINYLDTTAVEALQDITNTLDGRGVDLHFAGLTGPIRDVIDDSGLGLWLGSDHFHIDPYHAVLHVLQRWDAEEGTDRAEAYRETVEEEREDVDPTSEARYL